MVSVKHILEKTDDEESDSSPKIAPEKKEEFKKSKDEDKIKFQLKEKVVSNDDTANEEVSNEEATRFKKRRTTDKNKLKSKSQKFE